MTFDALLNSSTEELIKAMPSGHEWSSEELEAPNEVVTTDDLEPSQENYEVTLHGTGYEVVTHAWEISVDLYLPPEEL